MVTSRPYNKSVPSRNDAERTVPILETTRSSPRRFASAASSPRSMGTAGCGSTHAASTRRAAASCQRRSTRCTSGTSLPRCALRTSRMFRGFSFRHHHLAYFPTLVSQSEPATSCGTQRWNWRHNSISEHTLILALIIIQVTLTWPRHCHRIAAVIEDQRKPQRARVRRSNQRAQRRAWPPRRGQRSLSRRKIGT